jgi:organic radical activating enzyme
MDAKRLRTYLKNVVNQTISVVETGGDPHGTLKPVMEQLSPELAEHVRGNKKLSSRLAEELNKAWFSKVYYTKEGPRNVKITPFKVSEIFESKKAPNYKLKKEAEALDELGRQLRVSLMDAPVEEMDIRPRLPKSFMFMKRASAQRKTEERIAYAEQLKKRAAAKEVKRARMVIQKTASQYQKLLNKRAEAFDALLPIMGTGEIRSLLQEYAPDMELPIRKIASVVPKRVRPTAKQQIVEEFKEACLQIKEAEAGMEASLNYSPRTLSKLFTIATGVE